MASNPLIFSLSNKHTHAHTPHTHKSLFITKDSPMALCSCPHLRRVKATWSCRTLVQWGKKWIWNNTEDSQRLLSLLMYSCEIGYPFNTPRSKPNWCAFASRFCPVQEKSQNIFLKLEYLRAASEAPCLCKEELMLLWLSWFCTAAWYFKMTNV